MSDHERDAEPCGGCGHVTMEPRLCPACQPEAEVPALREQAEQYRADWNEAVSDLRKVVSERNGLREQLTVAENDRDNLRARLAEVLARLETAEAHPAITNPTRRTT